MKSIIYKYIFTFLALIFILAFSACVKVNIIGEIDSDYKSTYRGEVELSLSKYSNAQQSLAQESLLKLSEYWKSIGFESQVSIESETYYEKQKQCKDYEEAFAELFKMMTDEYSPFASLSYEYVSYSNFSNYKISGSVDATSMLDEQVYSNLNYEIKTKVDNEMDDLNAKITFILPNEEGFNLSSSSIDNYVIDIQNDSLTEFEFSGKAYNPDIAQQNSEIIEKYIYYTNLKYILIGILSIIMILVLLLLTKIRKSKIT